MELCVGGLGFFWDSQLCTNICCGETVGTEEGGLMKVMMIRRRSICGFLDYSLVWLLHGLNFSGIVKGLFGAAVQVESIWMILVMSTLWFPFDKVEMFELGAHIMYI